MSRAHIRILLILALTASPGCKEVPKAESPAEPGFSIDKKFERGPLSAHIRLDKDKLTLAQTLTLELQAVVQPPYKVRMPKIDPALKDFGLLDWNSPGSRLDPNGYVVTTYRYRLEPFVSGRFQVPAFAFEFVDPNNPDAVHRLDTEPIPVEVTSLLAADQNQLTIAEIEGVLDVRARPTPWWVALTCGILAVAAAIVMVVYKRRHKAAEIIRIFRPAHELAYERIQALVSRDLVGSGLIKEFYEQISHILRHYIEDRFDLRAPERTTEEFLLELQDAEALAGPDKTALAEFLRHCDLVKFAKARPATDQIQRTFDLVKAFIEKTRSDQRQVDVTDLAREARTGREECR